MKALEKHIHDFSISLVETEKNDIHMPSEILKEVARIEYTTMKAGEALSRKSDIQYIIKEIFNSCVLCNTGQM